MTGFSQSVSVRNDSTFSKVERQFFCVHRRRQKFYPVDAFQMTALVTSKFSGVRSKRGLPFPQGCLMMPPTPVGLAPGHL